MAYTYTVAQLITKAQSYVTTAQQQTTTAATNTYLQMANALADCIIARSEDVNVANTIGWLGIDTTASQRTNLLMSADAALVNANNSTGQTQTDYLTEAQLYSKIAYSLAVNTLVDRS